MVGNLTASDIIIGPIPGNARAETTTTGRLDGFHPGAYISQRLTRERDGFGTGGSLAARIVRRLVDIVFFIIVLAGSALFITAVALATPFVVGVSAVLGMMGISPDYRWRAAARG